ncbi:MAG: phage tail tape measure protein [Alloprevotella sp.]|nr:phage tail tape measure protein [Alloprevotella sp.]
MNATDIKEIVLRVNDEDVKQKIENLQKRLDNALRLKRDLEHKASTGSLTKEETKDLAKFTREVQRCETQLSKMRSTKQQVDKVLNNMSTSGPTELKNVLKALNKEIESGAVKRGTEEWKQYQKAIKQVNTELRKVQDEQKAVEGFSFGKFLQSGANLWMSVQGAMATITGIKSTVRDAVQAFADMEEAEADVMKYTGMTKQQVGDLNKELKEMDTRTAREKLNALAGDAGRLGIRGKQGILDFVSAADMINVALGEDLGEDAVKNIGKLAQLYGEDKRVGLKQAMLSTGSAINELAQNSSAAETYLLDFTARLAGVGKQANIAQTDIMGYAAVLDESMLRDETAATAMQQLIVKIFQNPAKMAKAAGLEVKAFSELVRTDANAALLQFFDAMKARGGFDSLAPMFQEMHLNGQRAVGVHSAVADKTDLLRERQQLANQAYAEANSIQNEFDVKNNTVQAQLDKAKKRFHELAVELGEKLLPLVRDGIHLTSNILRLLSNTISFVSRNAYALGTLTAMIAAYTVAVNFATIATKAKAAAIVLVNGVSKAYTATVKALHAAHLLLQLGMAKLQGNWARQSSLMLDVKKAGKSLATGWGILAAAGVALATVIINQIKKLGELSTEEKILRKIREQAAGQIAEEKNKIELLTAVARDEHRSLKDRQDAIKELNRIVPNYNGHLDVTTGKYRENKKALDKYINSLIRLYEIEGAKEELKRIGKQRAENKVKEQNARDDKSLAEQTIDQYYDRSSINSYVAYGTAGVSMAQTASMTNGTLRKAEATLRRANGVLAEVKNSNKELDRQESAIRNIYGEELKDDAVKQTRQEPEDPPISPTGGSGSGNNKNDKLEKEHREKLKQLDAEAKELDRKLQETIRDYQAAFMNGKLDVDAYREKVLQAEMTTAMQQRNLYDKNLDWQVEKWKERNDKVLQLEKTQAEKMQTWTIAALEKNEQRELRVLEEKHSQGLISDTAYQIEHNAITLKYLRQREKYYRKWGRVEDYDKAHLAVEKEVARQRIELLKKVADTQKKVRDEYLSKHPIEQAKEELRIQKEIMNALLEQFKNDTDKQKEIAETWNKIIAQIEVRLKKLKKTEGSRVLSEAGYQSPSTGSAGDVADGMISAAKIYENYEETKNKLFRQLGEREINQEEYSLAMEELEKLKYERIAGYATACYQTVSGAMQAASQLMQANYEIEAQKVEERYAREIAAAGEGTDKAKQLEARKQKELANLKNKYNKKAMAVEMAQAVAQTAVAAINAYASASKVAFWLGPVAAAAATAAGAIQIAAIAKQHETQSAGYYEGGFTGGQNYRREAGVVHEGEFVANHQAVKNPNLLPVLNMIDQAQRHNRVASLTAADVNRVAGGTAVAAAPQPVIIDSSSLRTAESIEKLNRMLEHPIKTYVVIDGPDGLHRNYQEYKKIIGEE